MIRFAQAAAIALCLIPSPLYAQSARFTVTVISASIYQSPNAGSAVIGQSWQGAVLDVRSDLAEWIEVAWPGTARGSTIERRQRIAPPIENGYSASSFFAAHCC